MALLCQAHQGVPSVNYFPVGGLFTLFLSVSTETVVCSFRVETEDLPLFVDPERKGGHRCSDEESRKKRGTIELNQR